MHVRRSSDISRYVKMSDDRLSWSIGQSIMLKFTWWRFDQSVKQLVVGQTTISHLLINSFISHHFNSSHILLQISHGKEEERKRWIFWNAQLLVYACVLPTNRRCTAIIQVACISRLLQLLQSFTAHIPSLTASSAGLGRRRWSSQLCYLHCLCTLSMRN